MNAELLRQLPTIQEFFEIEAEGELSEGTRILLDAMTEVDIPKGQDIVTYGVGSEDGMYILLDGKADVFTSTGARINRLRTGDFIGELGLINDDIRKATVRAVTDVRCANISKQLFEEIASVNRKIYGSFMNMLYTKTTKLITEQERIKSELSIATKIQADCLEHDFTEFNRLPAVMMTAHMRPAKEVGGDFYDMFMIDETHLCFLIADVSGKGVPAALFMTMAKTHIKNFASVGLPLAEVAARANEQLCYKNEMGMFATAFICVLDLKTDKVTYINAGHNRPFIAKGNGKFEMLKAKANLVLGLMEGVLYQEQTIMLEPGDSIYMYTDGVTEALNAEQEFFGDWKLCDSLNQNRRNMNDPERFVQEIYQEVDAFAKEEPQADDITMLYLTRRRTESDCPEQ